MIESRGESSGEFSGTSDGPRKIFESKSISKAKHGKVFERKSVATGPLSLQSLRRSKRSVAVNYFVVRWSAPEECPTEERLLKSVVSKAADESVAPKATHE